MYYCLFTRGIRREILQKWLEHPEDFDPTEAAEFEALCLLGEALDALLQPFINTELSLSQQIESLVRFSHLLSALYIQNGTSFISNQLYADLQAMVKNAVLMVPKTRLINGQLKVFICLLGDDVLEALFGRSRMIGGHSPNCSIGELRDRFGSAMTLDYIYEQYPELERKPRRLNMFRMRHVDHLRPVHFTRELRADSCNLDICWAAAVMGAESMLVQYGVRMSISFAERFRRKDTDPMRPLGGKYPAISGDVDRSMAAYSSEPGAQLIDPDSENFANLVAGVDIDALIASEKCSESSESTHLLFAEIDGADTTADEAISPTTNFQLGNLFTTLISYNGTHLGLAVAKCTLLKRSGPPAASVSAIPRGELASSSSSYTISGQVLSLIPGPGNTAWTWDGAFISFSLKKKKKNSGEEISRLRNLQVTVSSRLIDCNINDQAQSVSGFNLPGSRERTCDLNQKFPILIGVTECAFPYQTEHSPDYPSILLAWPIANTAIEESIKRRRACGVCQEPVRDTNSQGHVGQHILMALRGVQDPSVKINIHISLEEQSALKIAAEYIFEWPVIEPAGRPSTPAPHGEKRKLYIDFSLIIYFLAMGVSPSVLLRRFSGANKSQTGKPSAIITARVVDGWTDPLPE
ncbi:hypothetical protein B0H19DRAFT_1074017 [Mycena capillaripes]|nr:hypothetical protein B0H19DRAFT_1074017 [Mycena capillaripes]